jgi:uncharacterized iron-regulated membrane protein
MLRVLHKWIGLVIGLQFMLWTISGAGMALLNVEEVAGGARQDAPAVHLTNSDGWPRVQAELAGTEVRNVSLRPLLSSYVYEVATPAGTMLFDAASGERTRVDATLARNIATAAYAGGGAVKAVVPLSKLTLAVREHELPVWRIDFDDPDRSSYYVSGSTGALLERRNESWRIWDFLWMLHNMDYVDRTSFNHPLIIIVGFAATWLAITGLYLLFRTGWRSDFKKAKRSARVHRQETPGRAPVA